MNMNTSWNKLDYSVKLATYDAYMASHNEDYTFDDFDRLCTGLTLKGVETMW